MTWTQNQLTPICHRLFLEAKELMPPSIASRLVCSRAMRNHGSYRTVLLFNTWDRFQSDVLPKQHFCYCLGYDPLRLISGGTDWYFHLWLNTVRIYRDRLAVKTEMEKRLAQVCPTPFRFDILDRAISAKFNFNLEHDATALVKVLRPHYIKLIRTVHPILMPIIDRFSICGGRDSIKKEIASRGRIAVKPVRTARPDLVGEYSRSIPPGWRHEILQAYGHRCVHCNASLRGRNYHLDHKVPFSRGGRTVKENLQPLCPECNLRKGNRSTE
jgi:hypothetical protein